MIRFFTSIGGFLLGSLLFAFLMIIAFNPNFFAEKALKDRETCIRQKLIAGRLNIIYIYIYIYNDLKCKFLYK